MRHAIHLTWWGSPKRSFYRTVLGAVALTGFTSLYLASGFIGGLEFPGIRDETVHIVGHITIYGLLAVALAKALGGRWALAWGVSNALALGEEVYQNFVPGRIAHPRDAVINLVTITVFILGWRYLESAWRSRFSGLARIQPRVQPGVVVAGTCHTVGG